MKKLGLNTIRELFEEFYESKGHYRRGSFPLVPQTDKSLLLINSGMAPMKPYFAGLEEPPSRRMTTVQKCIRTADIENVGITSRHGTFFEMLGSFSFGDYFKRESITWGWEFLTEVLHMPTDRIWVSVYEKDDETYHIWKDEVGFPAERIVRLGKEDNFWEIGSGPCGPCSEIYYDRGEQYGCGRPDCKPGCECDRYIEFWNHVFTQFNNDGEGRYTELAQKNIDTGMGLERLACIMQGVDSIFDVDTIASILQAAAKATGTAYHDGQGDGDVSLRIITDHIRSAAFMISDHIMPGNEGRGYVLRRLIRRAIRHGRKLQAPAGFFSGLVDAVAAVSGDAYPELREQQDFIRKIVAAEEEQFEQTLDQGMARIEEYMQEMRDAGSKTLDGERAFRLHDTYGFPIDITEEILADAGFAVDRDGFEAAMAQQKQRGKADAERRDFAWEDGVFEGEFDGATEFTGYEHEEDDGRITLLLTEQGRVETLPEGADGYVVIDRTPFYAAGGGQVCDTGLLRGEESEAEVTEVTKKHDIIVHKVHVRRGSFAAGQTVHAEIDALKRHNAARNHTATHLLHAALREVLGDHAAQAGSAVDEAMLRFDFNHYEAMTAEQLRQAEAIVNEYIDEFLPVTTELMPLREAEASGAIGLFTEKYGDEVRVVSIGDCSRELCGGVHVQNSGQIGGLHILSESGIASGVRRIEAITGRALRQRLEEDEDMLRRAAKPLKADRGSLVERIKKLSAENKANARELEELRRASMGSDLDRMIESSPQIHDIRLVTRTFSDATIKDLRAMSDEVREKYKGVALVLAAVNGGKVTFLVSLTDDVVGRGYHAGKMVKEIAAAAGGGGGGKADMAQAGAKDPARIPDAFAAAEKLL
jgi:alanyl-tRNA synthetase